MGYMPQWTADVIDLSATPSEVANYWSMTTAATHTGLSPKMLQDYLNRPKVTNTSHASSLISRPARRFGKEPLYSPEQCSEYVEMVRKSSSEAAPSQNIETVTAAQAEELGLATMEQIAEGLRIGLPTLKRLARTYADFPPVLKKLSLGGRRGQPPKLRSRYDVAEWYLTLFGPPEEEAC